MFWLGLTSRGARCSLMPPVTPSCGQIRFWIVGRSISLAQETSSVSSLRTWAESAARSRSGPGPPSWKPSEPVGPSPDNKRVSFFRHWKTRRWRMRGSRTGADSGLLLNTDGWVAESRTSKPPRETSERASCFLGEGPPTGTSAGPSRARPPSPTAPRSHRIGRGPAPPRPRPWHAGRPGRGRSRCGR